MDGWIDTLMGGWMDDRYIEGWMIDTQMDGSIHGWMEGWMDRDTEMDG